MKPEGISQQAWDEARDTASPHALISFPSVGRVSPDLPSHDEAAPDANTGGENVATPHSTDEHMIVRYDGKGGADPLALGSAVEPGALIPRNDNFRRVPHNGEIA